MYLCPSLLISLGWVRLLGGVGIAAAFAFATTPSAAATFFLATAAS